MQLFHYPGCSTCRKARKWLADHDLQPELVHIVEAPPSLDQLKSALELSGLPLKKLFNTSGQSYRQGGFKDRLASMSRDEALAALHADGKLIKRPLLLASDLALVGFKPDAWQRLLGTSS